MNLQLLKLSIFFLLIPSILFVSPTFGQDNPTQNNYVILIDDSHDQFINSSLLQGAIADMQEIGRVVTTKNKPLTNATLTGVDLVIIPNPGEKSFTGDEASALDKWAVTGDRGIIFLSNPFYESNNSLSGKPKILNEIAQSCISKDLGCIGLSPTVFVSSEGNSKESVKVLTLDSIHKESLYLRNVSSFIFKNQSQTLDIATQSTTVKVFPREAALSAGFDSFVVEKDGKYSKFATANYLVGAIEKDNNRYILGGSTIMFSDLPNEENPSSSWYNTADNSVFWLNIVKWALKYEGSPVATNSEEAFQNLSILTAMSAVTGSAIMITGVLLYSTGKEIKLFDSSLVSSISNKGEEEKVDKSPLSKSQRKLQQRMKNK